MKLISAIFSYIWPRFIIFSMLYWLAIHFHSGFGAEYISALVGKLVSLQSLGIFSVIAVLYALLERGSRLALAKRRGLHLCYRAMHRLSIVGLEILTGLIAVTLVVSINILLSIVISKNDAEHVIKEEELSYGIQMVYTGISLVALFLLSYYKEMISAQEVKLTRTYKKNS